MPSIAAVSMNGVSPRSGLPKLRQFVTAAGSAPVTATLRAASATAGRRRGVGVEPGAAPVAVERDRDGAIRRCQPHDRRVAARAQHRPGAHEVVVLAEDPRLVAHVRRGQQPQQDGAEVARCRRQLVGRERRQRRRSGRTGSSG
jgi:hypothetical protein